MASPSFQLCFFLLLLASISESAAHHGKLTRLNKFNGVQTYPENESNTNKLPPQFETHYYAQTLDHFNYKPESYAAFQHRYILNFKYWGRANTSSPIFAYTGEETDVTDDVETFTLDLAAHFKGLVLYIEHRYYGESMPFGSADLAFQNSSTLGYLSSAQALADYAQVILHVKKNLSAENCPVIAVGGSYGGMLAAWFRLKYPHIVIGSLASSSPILYFDDLTPQNGYDVIVTKNFREASKSCYNTIVRSWSEIDKIAAEPDGLLTLSAKFNTCSPLDSSKELKDYLKLAYETSAQYDNPPDYPVKTLCRGIDGAPPGMDILGRIAAGFDSGNSCLNVVTISKFDNTSAFDWQECTEMLFPIGHGYKQTMFQPDPFNLKNYIKECLRVFGIRPRPHWVTTEFGGHDIKTVLKNFASNIIFTNGLHDPWSAGGVLEDISDSLVAIYTQYGAHCLDIHRPRPDDPYWLVEQRERELKIIAAWIAEYNAKKGVN